MYKLKEILKTTIDENNLNAEEVKYLLRIDFPEAKDAIFEAAHQLRERYFGKNVFAYGFVYFSTYCKNRCNFCFYRDNNDFAPRYRKTEEEIINLSKDLAASGVHLIDLTMGEDPYYTKNPQVLVKIVDTVKSKTKLPVMISPGVLDENNLRALKEAGADWYALYQETYDKDLFDNMRIKQSYEQRMHLKKSAKDMGYLVEEGLLTGIGDTLNKRAESLLEMRRVKPSQVRTMTFVPQKGTPLMNVKPSSSENELRMIAVMRLLYPWALIPASLDVEGLVGLKDRLMAGANVITSLIPAQEGLAGVSQSELDIENGSRSLNQVLPTVLDCGLTLGTREDYHAFICKEQTRVW